MPYGGNERPPGRSGITVFKTISYYNIYPDRDLDLSESRDVIGHVTIRLPLYDLSLTRTGMWNVRSMVQLG